MSRQKFQRHGRGQGSQFVARQFPGTDLSDSDKARVLTRFRALRGRGGVVIGFESMGSIVTASTPRELDAKTGAALTAITSGDPES